MNSKRASIAPESKRASIATETKPSTPLSPTRGLWTMELKRTLSAFRREPKPAPKPVDEVIKKGNLKEIIEFLISSRNVPDMPKLINNFLASYKKFCTTEELVEILNKHCSVRWMRLPVFIKIWVDTYYFRDFCIVTDVSFQTKKVSETLLQLVEALKEAGFTNTELNQVKLAILRSHGMSNSCTSPPTGRMKNSPVSFTSYKPKDIAQQMTLLEWKMFNKIDRDEFYNKGWSRDTREKTSSNITAMIRRSNEVSMWVASLVLVQKDTKLRSRTMEKLIAVAKYCKRLNNLNTIMAIVGGLEMWTVSRLQHKMSNKYISIYNQLKKLANPMHNWQNYRTILKTSKGPILPYLGVFLRDITFIEDGNQDFVKPGIINFEKVMLMGEQLKQIESFQQFDYSKHITPKPALMQYLTKLPFLTDEEIEKASVTIEPLPEFLDDSEDEWPDRDPEQFSAISDYSESMVSENSELSFGLDDDETPPHNTSMARKSHKL